MDLPFDVGFVAAVLVIEGDAADRMPVDRSSASAFPS
jgi:hypothetical protein